MAKDTARVNKTNNFFDSLEYKASHKRLTKELYDFIVISQKNGTVEDTRKPVPLSYNYYKKYEGKLIRKVIIKRLDVFGPEVYDTTLMPDNFLEKAANSVHIKTHYKIIQKNIIVKPGYYLNAQTIADNERILRELPSVNDVRVIITNYDRRNNTVDVEFIVKDVWSKGFGFETSDFTEGRIDFWDRNFLGTGHDFTNIIGWDKDKPDKTGYEGIYKVNNIFGSFINFRFNYISMFEHNEYNLKVSRDFFTQETKLAGGFYYSNTQDLKNIRNYLDVQEYNLDYENTRLWAAKAFPIQHKKSIAYRPNLILLLAFNKYDFYNGPNTAENLFYNYQSRAMILGQVAISGQKFYKTNYVYSFGRTEDIPEGFLPSVMLGFEKSEFKNRLYTQFSVKGGKHFDKAGYAFTSLCYSFFTSTTFGREQGAVCLRTNYITDLYPIGRFRFRQFVKTNYVNGYERYIDEYVSINKSDGIRGFATDSIFAHKKFILNTESVLFTPLYFYGFRFVFYGFFDLAYSGPDNAKIFSNKAYTGFGIGTRLRNSRLVFRTIQIQFGIYPNAPPDMQQVLMNMSGEPRLKPENFYVQEPEIFIYK